jgi:ACS family tartrate transporter-like MFS transporter
MHVVACNRSIFGLTGRGRMTADAVRASAIRKITRRIVPLLVIGYLVSYLDRINISFAALGMEKSFGLSPLAYGFAAGIFYIGYILAEVPSNIIMLKVGARIWLTRIMISWGVVAAVTAFSPNTTTLFVLRFLLGVAEAGFFPGIILYLTRWFPNKERPRAMATVLIAIPLSGLVGSPLNGWILSAFDGLDGLSGWRWVFLVGGVPAILAGIAFFVLLRNRPEDVTWLSPEERAWLQSTLDAEEAERRIGAPSGHRGVFRSKVVLLLSAAFFLLASGAYPLTYWLPSAIKGLGSQLTSVQIGWLSAVPFLLASVCMYLTGRWVKDRSTRPVQVALGVSVVAFVGTAVSLGTPVLAFAAISVATMAAQTAKPLFWALPTSFLAGAGAASGIALINSLGNLAGFVSPFAVGWIQQESGGNVGLSMGVMILANALAMVVIAATWIIRRRLVPDHNTTEADAPTP